LAKKLNDLLDQNKTIARGLLLLEKYVRDKSVGPSFQSSFQPSRPLPKSEL